jgi:hypothetical protein
MLETDVYLRYYMLSEAKIQYLIFFKIKLNFTMNVIYKTSLLKKS